MKLDERIYDRVKVVYEVAMPMPLSLAGALASVTILEEQAKRTLQPGVKLIEVTPLLKGDLKINKDKNETN